MSDEVKAEKPIPAVVAEKSAAPVVAVAPEPIAKPEAPVKIFSETVKCTGCHYSITVNAHDQDSVDKMAAAFKAGDNPSVHEEVCLVVGVRKASRPV